MGKTKVLISGPGLDMLQKSGKDPCGICLKGIGTNSIFCGGCFSCILKKCSGIPGPLKPYVSFRREWFTGQARPTDSKLMTEVTAGGEKLEVVPSFCYHGYCLSSGGSCELSTITRCRVAWGKFLSHHLQRKSFQFIHQEFHAPCKQNLGPNHIWLASPAVQWQRYDSLDVRCHHQGPSQLAGSVGEDAAWRSGKGTLHPPTQMAWPCRT